MCPNCMIPLREIAFESIVTNVLLAVMGMAILAASGWTVYQFLVLG
jgi:hypothetical protein